MSSETNAIIRLHLKYLVNSSNVQRMVQAMRTVYGTYNIGVQITSQQNINAPDLVDLETAGVLPFQTSEEQNRLFEFRDNARPNEIVIYFVDDIIPVLNGLAVHPRDRPGCVIARRATKWTLAHEVGHVLGILHHVPDPNRLMTKHTDKIVTQLPTLAQDELNTILNSTYINRG